MILCMDADAEKVSVVDEPHGLDDGTLNRVFVIYNNQSDDQMVFVQQFSRWKQGNLSDAEVN